MRSSRPAIVLATAVLCVPIASMTVAPARAQRIGLRVHVVDVDSAVPIAHARIVSLSGTPLPLTMTDLHGDAIVDVAEVGRTVRVAKAGYAAKSVNLPAPAAGDRQSRVGNSGSRADSASADPAGEPGVIEVPLARGAAIGGQVVDPLGAPLAGQAVRVALASEVGARGRQTTTNDRGEYRIGGLPEGSYVVSLGPPPPAAPAVSSSSPAPGGLEHTVIVRRGDEVGGIDFSTLRPGCVVPPQPAVPLFAPVPTSAIQGRVTTAGGMPLPCVQVVAFRGTVRSLSTVTDTTGRYMFRSLQPGTYTLEFSRAGYVTMQWGQQQAGQPGRSVLVRAREQRGNVDVRLARGSAITGTLLDEFLEPAENVTVRALELRGDDRAVAVGIGTAITDERGRYRLFGLLPGRYIVATAAASEPADTRTGNGYAPAYFPGEKEIAAAQIVEVKEEQERPYVDFAREPVRVATITGTAVNSRNEPITERVILVASQRSGAVIAETQGATVKGPDGAFAIPNVPPGDYVLQATSKRGDSGPPEFGMQYVTVYEEDPMAVRIKTAAGVDIQGRLIEQGTPPVDPRSFALTAVPMDWDQTSVVAGLQTLTPGEDGALSLEGITGPRRFVLTAAPPDWYLKSVRIRGREVTDDVAPLPVIGFGAVRDLEVVVSNRGALVEGDAVDGSVPASAFSVILFSSNPDHWFRNSRFLKIAQGSNAGRFRLQGIADGDYFIAAVDPLDGSAAEAWQNRDFLQSLIVNARRVRLREGDDRSLTLTLAHR
jgi:hypothetical protein